MESELLMGLIGSWLSLLLIINAFFTRKTLEKLSELDLRLAVYVNKHEVNEEISRWNRAEILSLRDRVHTLEGSSSQLLEYLKSQD